MTRPRYLVTSALPYANGPIHFGHIIGAYLPADVYVRYRRMRGDDVMFVCGTDEHGVAITINAEAKQQDYASFVKHWREEIKATFDAFQIEFGYETGGKKHLQFSGTSVCPGHAGISQQFFRNLDRNGYLQKKTEKQWFCLTHNMFLADRYIEGTCPFCSAENARGDECKKCGQWIDALALKDAKCKLCGNAPVVRDTTHWYLDLPRIHSDGLGAWFDSSSAHVQWKPNVRSFVANMLGDLHERPITRDLRWGVPVPAPDTDGKVLYVWFDAPIGYCSMTQELLQTMNSSAAPDAWLDWWADPNTRILHFIGKDNIGFHTIVFPAMLFGQKQQFGRALNLPWAVPAMEFYNLQGRKFSTSDGWTIDPRSFSQKFPNVDALRFMLLSTGPETSDSEFTFEDFQRVNNRDLADNLGNLLSRALRFANDKIEGRIVRFQPTDRERGMLLEEVQAQIRDWARALDEFEYRNACQAIIQIGRAANRYFDSCAPWVSIKTDRESAARCIDFTTRCIGIVGILSAPLMPGAAAQIRSAAGIGNIDLQASVAKLLAGDGFSLFTDFSVGEIPILFQKLDDKTIQAEIQQLHLKARQMTEPEPKVSPTPPAAPATQAAAPPAVDPAAPKAEITYDDFAKMEFRVATVIAAEKVEKADKLLKLQVDIGRERRQIVAGIASKYAPGDLIGKRVVVVCNLAPRKLRGIESQGMLLAADDGRGPVFVTPSADVNDGATVK